MSIFSSVEMSLLNRCRVFLAVLILNCHARRRKRRERKKGKKRLRGGKRDYVFIGRKHYSFCIFCFFFYPLSWPGLFISFHTYSRKVFNIFYLAVYRLAHILYLYFVPYIFTCIIRERTSTSRPRWEGL